MAPTTAAQQTALAAAAMPFALASLLSSAHVVRHLLVKEQRRKPSSRLYHRLVLSMNVALVAASCRWFWAPFAAPSGSPGHVWARGDVRTCTADAFVCLVTLLAVSTYYISLILVAYLNVRNNFEDRPYYRRVELTVHAVAWCLPLAISAALAYTENFNPYGTGCFMARYPLGCTTTAAAAAAANDTTVMGVTDTTVEQEVPCQRGGDDGNKIEIVALTCYCLLYVAFPTSILTLMFCRVRTINAQMRRSRGMQRIRDSARRAMMSSVAFQVCAYLFSFWLTWACGLVHQVRRMATGEMTYGLLIFSNCALAFQGAAFALVYFALERMGNAPKQTFEGIIRSSGLTTRTSTRTDPGGAGSGQQTTVQSIRLSARMHQMKLASSDPKIAPERRSFTFSIFDGVPDNDSPWARYIDEDADNDVNINNLSLEEDVELDEDGDRADVELSSGGDNIIRG